MRIVDVKVHLIKRPAAPPFRWRTGLPGSEPAGISGILRLITDEGIEGIATTNRGKILDDIVERRLRDELIGQNPLQKEWLWHRIWEIDRIEELPIYLLGMVDIALWDLTGKVAGLPLYQLLGGYRHTIPAYASTVTFASIEEYLDVADQCLALGYPAIKLHAWGDARKDAELCLALRKHVGATIPLMYDGSAGFDLPDAIYLGHALTEASYLWYEEPMREFSITAYKQLSAAVRVPLLVAETSDGAHMNTADFITSGCATFVRTSAGLKGGVTGAMRIAHLADAFQMRAEVHGGGLVHQHLCMAISNTTYYESLVLTNPVVREPAVDEHGLVHAPTAPGIGTESLWGTRTWEDDALRL
ncbi:mandelate racemase [Dictyobacter alpinus]|uniref:Mandelate racemase n=1 Tax=Dictyobacter alpinus TaxID=2014873 RepID=A0A402BE28_9CHLR|nr:enolase C-terminal domain-like protein [Dictyobacter alpinus]GCE29507.1 mandelate racemase [Dictyobacter alpinus]